MRRRFLAGCRGLVWAIAVASLILLPNVDLWAGNPVDTVVDHGTSDLKKTTGDDEGLRKPTLFPRANYVWPYATGPVYGLRSVPAEQFRKPGMLHTAVGSFDLTRGITEIPAELRASVKFDRLGAQYFIVQVHPDAMGDGIRQIRDIIESTGGAVVAEMAVGALVSRLTQEGYAAVQGQPGIIAVEPYHPAFKISPLLGRVPLPDPARALSDVYQLRLALFQGEDANAVAAALADLGANVTAIWPDEVRIELPREQLAAVASLEPVRWIEEVLPIFAKGEETTTTMETGRWNSGAIPYLDAGCDGGGGGLVPAQTVMVLDTGIQLDAGDLSDSRADAGTPGSAHRKVQLYTSTNAFGGSGDDQGCDATGSGGVTHGHVVSATALGNATDVDPSYGEPWEATDTQGNPWKLDGVAPGARLVAYDAQVTPTATTCDDPLASGLSPGNIYTDNHGGGSLEDAYHNHGARTFNFSWGTESNNTYGTNAQRIDQFLFDHKDAMLFISAGNEGDDSDSDGVPDPNTVSDPATNKNAVVVGASFNANDLNPTSGANPEARAFFSSVGPATPTSNRVAPILMAPGTDSGVGMGIDSEFTCRTNDNDQLNPVECDIATNQSGTSFSSPAAAGTGALIKDYFAQGFYPDATTTDAGNAGDQVADISGALVKAILVASADFMTGGNLSEGFRFNNEQGYGRIQLDNVLPVFNWAASPTGLIVADGGLNGDPTNFPGGGPNNTSLSGTAQNGVTETYTFPVGDNTQELRVACAWIEDFGESLSNDIDIELTAPDGTTTYWGNFFSEDVNRNNVLDAGEDCDGDANLTEGAWSIAVSGCSAARDTQNPTEAIMLSPDPLGNGIEDDPATPGIDEGADNMIQTGDYTLRVVGRTIVAGGGQDYACVLAGPVALGSSVRFNTGRYVCNSLSSVIVNEVDDTTDPGSGLTPTEVGSRVAIRVKDANDAVVDEEGCAFDSAKPCLSFTQPDPAALRFELANNIVLTDGTARDPGATWYNGVLDVRSGERLEVIYRDETSGSPDPDKERFNTAAVNCEVNVNFGGVVWGQFGMDSSVLVDGGCERDARGKFTFGFPDKYMDAGELIGYRIAFESSEADVDLTDAELNLRCVEVDSDSPADCKPGTAPTSACPDPDRTNNPPCAFLTVLDSPKTAPVIPVGAAISANFTVQVDSALTGTPDVEMVLGIKAKKSGKSVEGLVVQRHRLNVDEASVFYSTDFPTGGVEIRDYNNNEVEDNPTTSINFTDDYRFDTMTWSDLTAGGTINLNIQSPWNFDNDNGGFTVGIETSSDLSVLNGGLTDITNWGEDLNHNNIVDPGTPEDRDTTGNTGSIDNNWSTGGGCGWQTKATAASTGGVWHTGTIQARGSGLVCSGPGGNADCQNFETIPWNILNGQQFWHEILKTPEFEKVNKQDADGDGVPDFKVEFLNWAWNMSDDLPNQFAIFTWEFDTDTQKLDPVNLDTNPVFNAFAGNHGARSGGNAPITDGFPVFAATYACSHDNTIPCASDEVCDDLSPGSTCSVDLGTSLNGSVGNNREGVNSCFFEATGNAQPLHLAEPPDDDADNDGDSVVDEFVKSNGPIRNFDITQVNGPDMRFFVLEDFFGESGEKFQAALGFALTEPTAGPINPGGFGVAVDDMVVEWREFSLQEDTTDCTPAGSSGGACASVEIANTNMFVGSTVVNVRIVDRFPYNLNDADPTNDVNDCDQNGSFTDPGDDTDCNDNGTPDIVAIATSESLDQEILVLDLVDPDPVFAGGVYEANLSVSPNFDADGVLFLSASGTDNPTVTIRYDDIDDGTGARCPNSTDPATEGFVEASTTILLTRGQVVVKGARVTDDPVECPQGAGDGDPFADTNETVCLFLSLSNKTGIDLDGVAARLVTNDPDIDCVIQPFSSIGTLAEDATVEISSPFIFKVSPTTNRSTVFEDLTAEFSVTVSALQFDAPINTPKVVLDLDLDVSGGGSPTNFTESFEVTKGFGAFQGNEIDAGKNNLTASDGYRCQYNDPDFPNSNTYGTDNAASCFLGFAVNNNNQFDWHVHDNGDPDGGRAFAGSKSAHWGVHTSADPAEDTTRLKQLEAIEQTNAVFLGWNGVVPELSFKHQISLMDSRSSNTPAGESVDRGVVHVQLADAAGTPQGDWIKVFPYQNIYDVQGTDQFVNCMFDPIDDGNNEDDYFDPSDPNRRLGPSSTCFPEFVFGYQGDTNHNNGFSQTNIGRASDGPGLQGSTGPGTWVETRFDLSRWIGRGLRMRFLTTSIEIGDAVTFLDAGFDPPEFSDDGWYIDDILLSDTLSSPATMSVDNNDNSGLPGCGVACNTVTSSLTADPAALDAPGQVTELSAENSSADRCLDGTLQFQFWTDGDGNGVLGDPADTLLRDWTDNPVFVDAPGNTTTYGVKVRCSSAPSTCLAESLTTVTVNCPSNGTVVGPPFGETVLFEADKATLSWTTSQVIDALRGNLDTLRSSGDFNGSVETCLADNVNTSSVSDATNPLAGSGLYYLVRGTGQLCNEAGSWASTGTDAVDRDTQINADPNACP